MPTRIVPLEGDDPLKPQDLLICRGANCEEGAVIKLQPGGATVELAKWSPTISHPLGALLSGSWPEIISAGKNKLLLYNSASQAKIIYLKGLYNTDYNAPQSLGTFFVTPPSPARWGIDHYASVVNTPKGILFYNAPGPSNFFPNAPQAAATLVKLTETYNLCGNQPCPFPASVGQIRNNLTQPRGYPQIVRVRRNYVASPTNPSTDLLLVYSRNNGSAALYSIAGTTPTFQITTGTSQNLGAGWTNIAGISDEIFFYNQANNDYALGAVTKQPFSPYTTSFAFTRQVPGSTGVLASWSHIVPLMPTP